MAALKNTRYERFAQEVASGISIQQAYVNVGYRPNNGNAYRLTKDQAIVERIKELQGITAAKLNENAIKAEVTRAQVLAWLESDRLSALQSQQHAAAIRASELIGKELGMFVDKSERNLNVVQHVGDKPLTPDEWAKPSAEPIQAAPVLPSSPSPPEPVPPVVAPVLPSDTKH